MTQKDIQALCRRLNASPWQQSVLNEELGNPWHTGTPTEEGWYLLKYEDGFYCANYWNGNGWKNQWCGTLLKWQKIEEGEEVNG